MRLVCTIGLALSAMTLLGAWTPPPATHEAHIIFAPDITRKTDGEQPTTVEFSPKHLAAHCAALNKGMPSFRQVDAARFQLSCTTKADGQDFYFDTIKVGAKTFVYLEKIINHDRAKVTSIMLANGIGQYIESLAEEYYREGWTRADRDGSVKHR